MMWTVCAKKVTELGGQIIMGAQVTGCAYNCKDQQWEVTFKNTKSGATEKIQSTEIISSAAIRELIPMLSPALSSETSQAGAALKYRDFIVVMLILKDKNRFSDNWIYIHEPNVKVGRIQNFKSWSPEMVPDPSYCSYGLEYFCTEGDLLWESSDESLLELAKVEFEKVGLGLASEVLDGCVVRQPKAYPVYDDDYATNVDIIRSELNRQHPTLHLVGRNGMHKYNNQDHAMMTAMLTVENIIQGKPTFDVWQVNQDAEYHESGTSGHSGLRQVPRPVGA
ncbi:unnamed protein product [Sphagnum tenellum]